MTEENKDIKEEVVEEKKEEKVEVPKKFEELVKSIENLSVLDLSELVKVLEKKFGVSAAAPVAVASVAVAGGSAEAAEEKSEFTVEIKDAGERKIEVIKAVRTITGQGLKEAKDLVDAVANGPQVVKEKAPVAEAKEAEKLLKEAGAVVELK
jgi:large subunit ribosomal protein L7/L12